MSKPDAEFAAKDLKDEIVKRLTGKWQPNYRRLLSRRLLPPMLAGLATILWAGGILTLVINSGVFASGNDFALTSVAAIAGGLVSPVVLFWLVALVYQRTDPLLERRLEVQRDMARTLAPIDSAERRLDAIAAGINDQLGKIEVATDVAAQRIENLEGRFQKEINHLFSATTDADAKTVRMTNILRRERSAFGELVHSLDQRFEQVENRFQEISETMRSLSENLGDEADRAGNVLRDQAAKVEESARDTSATLTAISENLERQQQSLKRETEHSRKSVKNTFATVREGVKGLGADMGRLELRANVITNSVAEQVQKIELLSRQVGTAALSMEENFSEKAGTLSKLAGEALDQAERSGDEFARQAKKLEEVAGLSLKRTHVLLGDIGISITDQAREAETLVRRASEETISSIAEALKQLDTLAGKMEGRTLEVTELAIEKLGEVRRSVEFQADTSERIANDNAKAIERLRESLDEQAASVTGTARQLTTVVTEASKAFETRNQQFSGALAESKRQIEEIGEEFLTQRENLSEATRQSSETLVSLADRLRAETDGLRASTSSTAGEIDARAGELAGKIEQLEILGEEASTRFDEALGALDRNQQQLTSSVDQTTESFGRAAETLESTRARFLSKADRAVDQLDEGAGKLEARIDTLKGATADGIGKMGTLAEKIGQAAGLLGIEAARASGRVNEEMEQLEKRFGKGLDQALTLLEGANIEALEKSETAARAIAESADDLLSKAEGFAHRAEAFDHRLAGAIKDEFIRTSTLLIGNLQSMSVDVDRLMETQISDEVWKKYLSGDKSIFARRAVRLADRSTHKDIAKRFKEDREFRRYVLKYMQDFESLMENATGETRSNPLNVALLSSELGKLYVLLSQSAQSIS